MRAEPQLALLHPHVLGDNCADGETPPSDCAGGGRRGFWPWVPTKSAATSATARRSRMMAAEVTFILVELAMFLRSGVPSWYAKPTVFISMAL